MVAVHHLHSATFTDAVASLSNMLVLSYGRLVDLNKFTLCVGVNTVCCYFTENSHLLSCSLEIRLLLTYFYCFLRVWDLQTDLGCGIFAFMS